MIRMNSRVSHAKSNHPSLSTPSHIAFDRYFNFSNSPRSTTRNSLLAHNTTLSTKPGRYPPPTIAPSLHVRPCHNSSIASKKHTTSLTCTTYLPTKSATSSETYGTGLRSASGASTCAGTFHPYPPFLSVLSSDVLIILTLTGGSGRKYSVYALARKLAIAAKLGMNAETLASSGMCRSAGARGSAERRRV
jgi:hypothetical protein